MANPNDNIQIGDEVLFKFTDGEILVGVLIRFPADNTDTWVVDVCEKGIIHIRYECSSLKYWVKVIR